MNNNNNNKYDPNVVIAAANAAPDLDSGRFIFQSALLEWVDDVREGGDQLLDSEQIREAVATLWLALAQYLIQSKQYKSATETFDEAVTCPVASSVGRVHAEAARFAVERGKRKTAQTIYVNALQQQGTVVTDEQDRELLWHDFLELMRETNPQLTLTALQEAVEREATAAAANEPESSSPSKRIKRNDDSPLEQPQQQSSQSSSRTHVVTLDSVEEAVHNNTTTILWGEGGGTPSDPLPPLPPEIMAAWMSRDGNAPPQPPTEHALFAPSPPKLSDPTAKDILGVDMAVRLVERLLTPSGSLVLEVCRGLWAWQGFWEQTCGADGALEDLDQTLLAQHEHLENELEARRSVAGGAADAVRQMNERERHNFQTNAQQQREQILTRSAWELRRVLCSQQIILAQLQVPGFEEGPTVDDASLQYQSRIGQYLHSAFFIRTKMGAAPHESMLKSQLTKLKREQENSGTRSPLGGHSPLPLRHRPVSPVPPPSYNLGASQQQPQQQQQTMMGMPVGGYHTGGGYAPPMPTLPNQPGGSGLPTYMPQLPSYGGMVPPPPNANMMMMMPPPQGLPPLPGHHTQLPPPPPPMLPPGAPHYPPPPPSHQQQQQHYPPYYPPPR